MATNTDSLREIYLDVAGEETITEEQKEGRSRDPVGEAESDLERSVSTALQDGLDDAVDGAEVEFGAEE